MTGSLTRAAGENVGNYAISQGNVAASNNYTATYAGANLAINPAPLTITAAAKSKTYGAADPALPTRPPALSVAILSHHDRQPDQGRR